MSHKRKRRKYPHHKGNYYNPMDSTPVQKTSNDFKWRRRRDVVPIFREVFAVEGSYYIIGEDPLYKPGG